MIISESDPTYSCSSGGALKVSIDHLPVISPDESVHDGGADDEEPIATPDLEHDIQAEANILEQPACIAYHMSLRQLVERLQLPEQVCKHCGTPSPFDVRITSRGTAAIIEWVSHCFWCP